MTKVLAGALGTAALAGAYVYHEGAVRVSVDEARDQGTHLHLLVPAALVPVGMRFVPEKRMRETAAHLGPWLPAIRVACRELERLPDAELVEVRDRENHVHVMKRGELLVIDVKSARETVHVSFPLRLAERAARELESFAPAL